MTTTTTLSPTDVLRHEHELIKKALAILSSMGQRIAGGGEVPRADVEGVLDFFKTFTDGCHHAKEEKALFPAMEAAGFPRDAGPIGVMLHEHELGRSFMGAMRDSVPTLSAPESRKRFVEAVEGYERLLSEHIEKENSVLFRMAEQVLAGDRIRAVAEAFERHEQELGPGVHEKFHALVRELSTRYDEARRPESLLPRSGCCGGGHCS
ncbi:MAG: hemerythrin domain-containing protein [Acidobacteriota bacterium]